MSNEVSCQGFEAFSKHLNIDLFNGIVAFVMAACSDGDVNLRGRLSEDHIWYSPSSGEDIQTRYGFRYFGELLERFEDKAGSEIADIRAIALAMAYTKDLLGDDMFVGSQKRDFIRKITRLSVGDTYLKGALYLLKKDEVGAVGLLGLLTQTVYTRTEELIFVMSLYDDFERAFLAFKPQFISMIGVARTMPADGNMEIYGWLIRQLYKSPGIKKIRTKDMALIRALIELPASFVKTGGRPHSVLLENGYSAGEIIHLNSFMVRLRPISGTIDEHSIVAEKIAVEMCATFINSADTHSPYVYEHLGWIFKKYDDFRIKINGFRGIYDAIKDGINLANPQTFIWLFKTIEPKDVFRFDIMDTKWDVLSRELDAGAYRKLFDSQLEADSNLAGAQIAERIEKYDALTGKHYLTEFEREYKYTWKDIFAILVSKGVLDIKESFESCKSIDSIEEGTDDETRPPILIYIREYIRGAYSREAFDFFKYFFGEHSIDDMIRIFLEKNTSYSNRQDSFFSYAFYKGPSGRYGDESARFEIERKFLSYDEHRELFGWLDDYMFQFNAENYTEFTALMLADPFIATLFPKSELRQVYDMVRGLDIAAVNNNSNKLKRIFLSETELQAEREAYEAHERELRRQADENRIKTLRNELAAGYDGTFMSLLKYLDSHSFRYDGAVPIAAEYLVPALSDNNYALERKELARFMKFAGKLLEKGCVDFSALKNYISMIEEGVQEYAENN